MDMAHPIKIVVLAAIAMMSPLMTMARPAYDVDGSTSSDSHWPHPDDAVRSIFSGKDTSMTEASEEDDAETKAVVSKTVISPEDLREKLFELNNLDRSSGKASSDGLVVRLADGQLQYPVYDRRDVVVNSRRRRSVTDTEELPDHYRRHISQPPIPFDDGTNIHGRSACPWRYEDDTQANRFPHTLRVAVKTHTGSRCIDPATGAPRRDLRCLPVEYKLNVLRKDSDGVWQISSDPEFVTVGYTCGRSRTA